MCGGGLGKALGAVLPLVAAYFFPPATLLGGIAEGAAAGATGSALSGGDVGKGALYGGVGGGIAGGFSGAGAGAGADAAGAGAAGAGTDFSSSIAASPWGTTPSFLGSASSDLATAGASAAPSYVSGFNPSSFAAGAGTDFNSSIAANPWAAPVGGISGGADAGAGAAGAGTDFSSSVAASPWNSASGVKAPSMIAPNAHINPNLTNPGLAPTTPGVGNILPTGVGPAAASPSEVPSPSGSSIFSDIGKFIKDNKKSLVPGLGMALNFAQQSKIGDMLKQQPQLMGSAGMLNSNAQPLINSLNTGVLPPGGQQMVDQALQSEETAIRSKYAQLGLSGSTMETQELNSAVQNASALRFKLANQAVTTGLTMLGQSNDIYTNLAKMQLSQDQALQNALASFSGSSGLQQALK